MSSNPLRLKFLFQKYLNNSCTKEDLKEFWHLMSQLSKEDLVAIQLQDLWNDANNKSDTPAAVNWEKSYIILQQRIAEQEIDYLKIASGSRKRTLQLAVAAALIGLLAVAYFLYSRPVKTPVLMAKVNNAFSRQQIIHLSDSTIVTLSSKSRLDYPSTFTNNSTREVYLTGEAYFNVKHDDAKQFIVHSGTILTKVLGTAFNIKAIPGESKVSITVTRGRVQVIRADTKKTLCILLPGYQVTVNNIDNTYHSEKVNVQQLKGWKNEHLIFDDITFAEAAVLVGIRFGVELKFRNEALRNCRFTGDFSNDSLDDAMDIICEVTNTNWQRDSDKIIWLSGKGCE